MNSQTKDNLTTLFQNTSFTVFRELYECVLFERVVRLETTLKNISKVEEWISKLNLEYSIGNKIFKAVIDKGMDSWSSTLTPCSKKESSAMCFVYVNSNKSKCNLARNFDESGEDFNFGLLLNYPTCCVESFLHWHKKNEHDPISMVADSFKLSVNLQTFNFPNPFLGYIGKSLYSHFPCSLDCSITKGIVRKKLHALKSNLPSAYNEINTFKKSLVLFKQGSGICIWTQFKVQKGAVNVSYRNLYGQGQLKIICEEVDQVILTNTKLILLSNLNELKHLTQDRLFFGAFSLQKS